MSLWIQKLHQVMHLTIRSKSDYVRSIFLFWSFLTLPFTFTMLACAIFSPSPTIPFRSVIFLLLLIHFAAVLAMVLNWFIEVKPKLKLRDQSRFIQEGYVRTEGKDNTIIYAKTFDIEGLGPQTYHIVFNQEGDILDGPRFIDAKRAAWQQAALEHK